MIERRRSLRIAVATRRPCAGSGLVQKNFLTLSGRDGAVSPSVNPGLRVEEATSRGGPIWLPARRAAPGDERLSSATLRHSVQATLFIATAGFVDAVGFLTLSGLFTSFMSGNSTQFALNLGRGSWVAAWPAGAVTGLFVVGVVLGRLASAMGPWSRPLTLTVEAVLLSAPAAFTLPSLAQGALMTIAMGAQNEILPRRGEARLGLTYVTGTLVSLGERLADALRGVGSFSACLSFVSLWLGLVAGGAAGAAAFGVSGPRALAAPAGTILLLAASAVVEARRSR